MDFGIDNILSETEIEDLFSKDFDDIEVEPKNDANNDGEETEGEPPAEVEEEPESVGDEEDNETKEDPATDADSSSPNDFYSSIAEALVEDGVLSNLDKDKAKNIKDADSFREAIAEQIRSGLSEQQKRIDDAMNAGIEPNQIKEYEALIAHLNGITEADIVDESDKGKDLRLRLISQDLKNRGFSEEKIRRALKNSFEQNTDIDDAKDALEANREFFKSQYQDLIDEAKEKREQAIKADKEAAENFKKMIFDSNEVFDGIKLTDSQKREVYDVVTKPNVTTKGGMQTTELKRYMDEHREDYLKNIGIIYVLTKKFTDWSALSKPAVNKARKSGVEALEKVINSTSRRNDGSINFTSSGDPESYFSKYDLDI